MAVGRCAVLGCRSNQAKMKAHHQNLIFHNFPKPTDNDRTALNKKWIERCGRPRNLNTTSRKVCSLHFSEHDYLRDLKNELLGLPVRKRLKPDAVPSLHLLASSESESQTPENETEAIRIDPDEDFYCPKFSDDISSVEMSSPKKQSSEIKENEALKCRYEELLAKYETLQKEAKMIKRLQNRKIRRLHNQLIYYKYTCWHMRHTIRRRGLKLFKYS